LIFLVHAGDDAADFPGDTYMRTFEHNLNTHMTEAFMLIESNGVLGPVVNGIVTVVPQQASSYHSSTVDTAVANPIHR
jgi:hypothetical protein